MSDDKNRPTPEGDAAESMKDEATAVEKAAPSPMPTEGGNADSDAGESDVGGSDVGGSDVGERTPAKERPPPEAAKAAPPPPPVTPTAAAPARSSAAPIAWLALVLVLAVSAAAAWLLMEGQRREAELLQRVRALESTSGQDTTTFDQMRDNLLRKIELETEAMQAQQQRATEDQQRALARQERAFTEQQQAFSQQQQALARQEQALARVEDVATEAAQRTRRQIETDLEELTTRLVQQEQLISELSAEDRTSWALAEAQYLLRLANQRLIMTGDSLSAEAMLRSADSILRELDEADLHGLRAALAEDLAAVRAIPQLDTQGLYLRLQALIRQTNDLVMFELPERESPGPMELSEDWKTRLKQGYDAAIEKLSEYIVVSRRDVPVETLMDPQYEGLVRQNMRMLLEQAQVAMLSGNQELYGQSLERALGWVDQFFKNDEQAAVAMTQELRDLAGERVSVDLPNLGDSLTALEEVLRQRLSRDRS